MNAQINAHDLNKKIQGYLETLAIEIDISRQSEAMQKYLEFVARFHQYSPTNIFLILLAKPEATHVAGYQSWLQMNRFVKKGERGIAILAPLIVKKENEERIEKQHLVGFKTVFVWDISQTDGTPLPPQPNWRSPEKNQELQDRLIRYIQSESISVSVEPLPRGIQGVSMEGKILLDPESGFKTTCHEYAHSCLHLSGNNQLSHAEMETEAESVAFVVCKHFGFTALASSNYLILNQADKSMILASLGRIQKTASEIIRAIED